MGKISGAALRLVQGLVRVRTPSSSTEFDDGHLSQVLDVGQLARRAGSPFSLGGWFHMLLNNVHAGATDLDVTVNLYSPGALTPNAVQNGFPAQVPNGYDFWIASAHCLRIAGAGALTNALLWLQTPATMVGIGVDDSGTQVPGQGHITLARWDGITVSAAWEFGETEEGSLMVPIGLRVPRGATINFATTAAAAATFRAVCVCGIFPEGMGQDLVK